MTTNIIALWGLLLVSLITLTYIVIKIIKIERAKEPVKENQKNQTIEALKGTGCLKDDKE